MLVALGLGAFGAVAPVAVGGGSGATTTLVSRQSQSAGGAGGDFQSTEPSASANGRLVAFESEADNLSGADDNRFHNVFVRDLKTRTTTLVSRRTGDGGAAANDSSHLPSISGDGRSVAVDSNADNLSDAVNSTGNVFQRSVLAPPIGGPSRR